MGSLSDECKDKVRRAYGKGELKVKSVDRETGEVVERSVVDVLRHDVSGRQMVDVRLEDGRSAVFTTDHSLFEIDDGGELSVVEAGKLLSGSLIVTVDHEGILLERVQTVTDAEGREFAYDLSVPGPENFVLSNGILAHNSYSIGGVSLSIEKSSKYQSMKDNAESQFEKMLEAKERTVKHIRGLRQSRYGLGVRSAFGPATGPGVLTPRKFLGF